MKKSSPIINVLLIAPNAEPVADFPNHSWLLSAISTFPSLEVIGYLAEGVRKDVSLGIFFADLEAKNDGTFDLELGVTLADLFPNLNGKLEYSLSLIDDNRINQEIAISNQMVRIRYKVNSEDYLALAPRYVLKDFDLLKKLKFPENPPVDLLKTTISWRTILSGNTAEEALENSLIDSTQTFVKLINRFIAANLALSREDQPPYLVSDYSFSSFDFIYFIIRGKDQSKLGHGRISNNLKAIALNPGNYDSIQSANLLKFIDGERVVSTPRALLISARTFLRNGNHSYALLQMVIAAEVATTQFVHKQWKENGVSNSKLKEYEKDITYSQMLNIHLYSLSPKDKKPDSNLIGDLNRARDLRNDFMHEGTFVVQQQELERLYLSTFSYLEYIESLT